MSLLGNRTRNLGIQASTAERSPQPAHLLPRCSPVCPCPEAGASGELIGRVCGNAVNAGSAAPPRGLWPFARRNSKVTRDHQARPGPLSHPTQVILSPFPVCMDRGFLGCVCLKQAQADVGQKPVGRSCLHPRGELAGWDGESPGSAGCPGWPHALRWVSFLPGGYLSRHMSLLEAEVRAGRSSCHTGQAQLGKLQARLADSHYHCRVAQWMWPMKGTPRPPP